ncbi:MAG: M16 family metallopeptidase, partial [bacterium]
LNPRRTKARQRPLNIASEHLRNGLEVLMLEDHSSPVATVLVWYRVGSRNDPPGKTGIAHLLEHMMFKGTRKRKAEEHSQIVQRMGGSVNAFTYQDGTAYYAEVPSSQIETILELEADRMVNNMFREFKTEREVVMEERRRSHDNDPFGALHENLVAAAYYAHPYRNPIIGWMDDIRSISLDDLAQYYRTYYRPNNAVALITGDIEPKSALAAIRKHFGAISNPPLSNHSSHPTGRTRQTGPANPPPMSIIEPPQVGERTVEVIPPTGGTMPMIAYAYRIPPYRSAETPALDVLSRILSLGQSSRLYQSLIQDQQLVTDASGEADFHIDPGLFYFFLHPQQGKSIDEVRKAVDSEVARLMAEPVADWELEKARNQAMADFTYAQDGCSQQGFMLGYVHIMDSYRRLSTYMAEVGAVTAADVQQIAQKYLQRKHRTVALLLPNSSA